MSDPSQPPTCPVTVTLSTELPPEHITALLKQSCRAETTATLLAHDPQRVPQLRIYDLGFTSAEERDRFLIAMRMREQQAAGNTPRTVKAQRRA
jgi:hypothetical protein